MISSEIVKKIIADNDNIVEEAQRKVLRKNAGAKDYADSDSRLALRHYIAHLTIEDIIDLCALMDYGRDICNDHAVERGFRYFTAVRKDIAFTMKDRSPENIANYLIGKGEKLSEYLAQSLELYHR